MKKTLSIISALGVVGAIGIAFAAWNFGSQATDSKEIGVTIDVANEDVPLGTFTWGAYTTTFELDDQVSFDLDFIATFVPDTTTFPSLTVADVDLLYYVDFDTLSPYLEVVGVNSTTKGTFVSGTKKEIAVTWKLGKNPTNITEYEDLEDIVLATPAVKIHVLAVLK